MPRRELDPGLVRIEVIIDEKALLEVQSLLDAATPSDAVRILISNRITAERAKRDEMKRQRGGHMGMSEAPAPDFPQRAPSEEDWKERREVRGERRWRRAGDVVEEPPTAGGSNRDEHPIRAYQRRVEQEEQDKQHAKRGGSLARGGFRPGGPGGRPPMGGNRPAGQRPEQFGNEQRGNERPGAGPGHPRPSGEFRGRSNDDGGRPPYRDGGRPGGPGGPGGRPGGRPGGPGGRPGGGPGGPGGYQGGQGGYGGGRPSGGRPGGRPGGPGRPSGDRPPRNDR